MSIPRVAIVTQDLRMDGGLFTATQFIYTVLKDSGRYSPEIVSLASNSSDPLSVSIRRPGTWFRGVCTDRLNHRDLPAIHVGAWMGELEFQRYCPRAVLGQLLAGYDVILVVAGTAAMANVARHVPAPVLVWTASTSWSDRRSRVAAAGLLRRLWTKALAPIIRNYELRMLGAAHTVFALSDYTLESVRPYVPPGRLLLGPCGVDVFAYDSAPASREGIILSVGRLSDPRKNVMLLLRAYAHLHADRPNTPELWLAGAPPEETAQAFIREAGIGERVRILGPQTDEGLRKLYREASIYVLSSDEEGLGIVILEAMASGVPVVSTDCGGPATMVIEGRTGFLTPVGDTAAMASAIRRLLDDPALRAAMGAEGRRVVEERFSLQGAGRVFLDRLDSVLDKPPHNCGAGEFVAAGGR